VDPINNTQTFTQLAKSRSPQNARSDLEIDLYSPQGIITRLSELESTTTTTTTSISSQNNSINTLYSNYTNISTTHSISAGLQEQLDSINIVAGSNVTVVQNPNKTWTISSIGGSGGGGGTGNGWTPIAGTGMSITAPTTSSYLFSVDDYIGATEVASISSGLQSQLDSMLSRITILEQNLTPLAINTFDMVSPFVI